MDHHLRLTRTTATAKDRPVEALTRSRRIRLLVNRSVANRPGHGGPLCGFCFSLLASFSFFTKLRRESNANRQAVAKTFSLSPSLSFSLSLSLSRARSVCLSRRFSFFFFFSARSLRPKRQTKTSPEEQLVAPTTHRRTHAPMLFDN